MEKDKLRITEVKIFRINVFKKTELLRGPSHVKNEQQEKATNNKGKHFREITTKSNSAVVQESRNKIKLEFKETKQTNENDGRNFDDTPKVKLLRRNNATEIRGPKPSIAESKSEDQGQFKTDPKCVQDLGTEKSSSFNAKFQVNKAVAPQIKRSEIEVTVVKSILPRPTSKTVLSTPGNDPQTKMVKFLIKKDVQKLENTKDTEGQHYLQTRSKPERMGKVLVQSNRKVPLHKDDQERNSENSNVSNVQAKQTELVYQPKQILRKGQVQKREEAIKPPSGITPEVKKPRRSDEPEYLDKMREFIAFKFRNISGENLPKATFECKVCETSFDNVEEAKTKHDGLIPNCCDTLECYYSCRICFLRMDTVYQVLRHESQVHYCENCKKMYASEYSKNNHLVACKISSKF